MKSTEHSNQYISDESIIHVMSKNNEPVAHVKNGETFTVKTRGPGIPDEVFEKDYSDGNYPARILSITGPIYVDGAEPGDVLEIHIEDIQYEDHAKMWMGQWMGILMDEVTKPYLKKVEVKDGHVLFNENIRIPFRKMVGTLGVAPAGEDVPCLIPGTHGANMDVPTLGPGSSLFVEVQVSGALLAAGDVHGTMGDGEILGTGVEIGSDVTMTVHIRKDLKINVPMIETPKFYQFVVSHKDLLQASKEATKEAIQFIQNRIGLSFEEAYCLVGQAGNLKIAQVVNPIFTVTMDVPKYVLTK